MAKLAFVTDTSGIDCWTPQTGWCADAADAYAGTAVHCQGPQPGIMAALRGRGVERERIYWLPWIVISPTYNNGVSNFEALNYRKTVLLFQTRKTLGAKLRDYCHTVLSANGMPPTWLQVMMIGGPSLEPTASFVRGFSHETSFIGVQVTRASTSLRRSGLSKFNKGKQYLQKQVCELGFIFFWYDLLWKCFASHLVSVPFWYSLDSISARFRQH